eukprot:m.19514 g.19514  ORF g.19514 m.19514 type:complete len:607 (-) comp3701_c0_seq1:63-1883(-)
MGAGRRARQRRQPSESTASLPSQDTRNGEQRQTPSTRAGHNASGNTATPSSTLIAIVTAVTVLLLAAATHEHWVPVPFGADEMPDNVANTPTDPTPATAAPTAPTSQQEDGQDPEDHRGVDYCDIGTDFDTLEQLMQTRATPCLVRGLLQPSLVHKVLRSWSLAAMRKNNILLDAQVSLRTMTSQTSGGAAASAAIMRYSNRRGRSARDAFASESLGVSFPQDAYDAWEFKPSTLRDSVFNTHSHTKGSFSTNIDAVEAACPKGVKMARKLASVLCPYGCPKRMDTDRLLWLASPGLGQQLHFDAHTNLFFHVDGNKSMVLVEPDTLLHSTHLLPEIHPGGRQSQLQWSSATPHRHVTGVGATAPEHMVPHYTSGHKDVEHVVHLRPGDLLYVPSYWGHETFGGGVDPTVSMAFWSHPTVVHPLRRHPEHKGMYSSTEREEDWSAMRGRSLDTVTRGATTAQDAWAGLRTLGEHTVALALQINETATRQVLKEWREQRWRPIFHTWKLETSGKVTTLPSVVCGVPQHLDRIHATAQMLADHVVRMASWHHKPHQPSVVRHSVLDALDALLRASNHPGLPQALEAAGLSTPESRIHVLVHSLGGCEA